MTDEQATTTNSIALRRSEGNSSFIMLAARDSTIGKVFALNEKLKAVTYERDDGVTIRWEKV